MELLMNVFLGVTLGLVMLLLLILMTGPAKGTFPVKVIHAWNTWLSLSLALGMFLLLVWLTVAVYQSLGGMPPEVTRPL